ncbi:uncharacterized protein LOC127875477 [Dreissena polymorpha]|uniref:uncharacterized protein LOC127875477 n=1 Tax=Dreissena polymorpha TaxID=45954 RepID=UPI0022646B61|nr:uncharacterized protein LOC127875477 [Dreissena polymorpha]
MSLILFGVISIILLKRIAEASMQLEGQSEVFVTAPANQPLTLDCTITGRPQPTYTWSKQGSCGRNLNATGSKVHVTDYMTIGDAGTYVCNALSGRNVVTQIYHVAVNRSEFDDKCNFENNNLCSWRQDSHDIFDWTLQSGTTSSGGTGPPGDHTTHGGAGKYIYIQASDPRVQGDNAAIVSHTLSANKPTCLSFFYNMFGDSIGDLDVTIVDKCSGQTQTVFHESGNKGEAWKEANVSIPASAVPNEYEIKIGATVGSSFEGDIALDDIFIQETSCAAKNIRLVNGSRPSQGRLEVFYNNTWGTVCGDNFDGSDAMVVCRMLGFIGNPLTSAFRDQAAYGRANGQIWLDDVRCNGTESNLFNCPANNWGVTDCSHGEDVGVDCDVPLIFRLVNGSRLSQGRLEVFHNDKWGTVCDDDFDSFEAKVVCRMMGFNGNLFVPIALSSITYGQGTGQIWLDNMMCKGSECSLVHCQTKRWGDHNCQHSEDIGVDCTPEIRLVNGSRSSHGRLEVFYNNMWGTVCDDSFDILEAIVVCRMLGFTGDQLTFSVRDQATYGQGIDQIWLDDLGCNGTELNLFNCRTKNWGDNNCNHDEDVGVDCDFSQSVSIIGNQPVKENSSFTLCCPLSTCSTSTCTYRWSSSKAISVLSSQQDITFTHITRDWNTAKLFCEITVNGSVFIRRSTTMNVQYGPLSANISVNSPLIVTDNTSPPTAILCSSPVCNPSCNANWFNGSTRISSTTLFSTPVSRYFAGSYTCNVSNAVGFSTTQLAIIVNYGPSEISITPSQENHTLVEGASGQNIICSVWDYFPSCRVQWKRNNIVSQDKSVNGGRIDLLLFSRTVSRDDTNMYTCTAKNLNSSIEIKREKTLRLTVLYGPDAVDIAPTKSTIQVVEGQSVHVVCTIRSCYKDCNMKWTHSSGSTTQSQNVTSLPLFESTHTVNRQEAGVFVCTGTNLHSLKTANDTMTLDVLYAPDVTLHWDEGEKTFTCTAAGNPDTYTFHALELHILGSPVRNISFLSGTGGLRYAVLKELSYQDNGTYTCTVENGILKNGAKRRSHTLEVVIKDVPILLEHTKTYSVFKGDPLTVTIPVYAFPAVPRTGIVIMIGHRIMSTSDSITVYLEDGIGFVSVHSKHIKCDIQTLLVVINATQEDYFGNCTVKFTNAVGTTTAHFEIFSQGPPDAPLRFEQQSTTYDSVTFTVEYGSFNGENQTLVLQYRRLNSNSLWANGSLAFVGNEQDIAIAMTVDDLSHDTAYEFRVYAFNVYGQSEYSVVVPVATA